MPRLRKHAKIKVSQIRALAEVQATESEAAGVLGIKTGTFREALRIDMAAKKAWEEGRARGKVSLRRRQWKLSENNASMAIFLGKQWLNQNETQRIEHSGRDGGPIRSVDLSALTPEDRVNLRALAMKAKKR